MRLPSPLVLEALCSLSPPGGVRLLRRDSEGRERGGGGGGGSLVPRLIFSYRTGKSLGTRLGGGGGLKVVRFYFWAVEKCGQSSHVNTFIRDPQ